jgi:hypothetical protein
MSQIYIKPKTAEIIHPVIMFKLAKSYKKEMQPWRLYTLTRGQWKMDINNAKQFKYALACDAGLVVEVYEIESWHQKKLESNIKKQMLLNIGAKVKPHSNILSPTTSKNL